LSRCVTSMLKHVGFLPMKNSKGVTLLEYLTVLAAVIFVLLILVYVVPRNQEVVIDCRIAEISPDIPIRAKEECRKLNIQRN